VFDPWIAGPEFTSADIVGYFASGVAAAIASAVYQWDIGDALAGYRQWRQRVGARPFVKQVDSEWRAALQALGRA
jgi:glutathione S-transferase